jgi:hypothetical protein
VLTGAALVPSLLAGAADIDFYAVARWVDGKILEENLFYDLTTYMPQVGLS